MSEGGAPPGAYFIGRPANNEQEAAPPAVPEPNPVTDNSSTPGDYFVGRPAGQQQEPAPAPAAAKKGGFLANWFPCLAGGQVAN